MIQKKTLLQRAGADVVLNAHSHNYQRWAPQTPTRARAPEGIREFVVGTGGASFFFFQAEDGIRVHCVTGVQTCALPILMTSGLEMLRLELMVSPTPPFN